VEFSLKRIVCAESRRGARGVREPVVMSVCHAWPAVTFPATYQFS